MTASLHFSAKVSLSDQLQSLMSGTNRLACGVSCIVHHGDDGDGHVDTQDVSAKHAQKQQDNDEVAHANT